MLHMHNTSHIKFAINYVLNERNEKKKTINTYGRSIDEFDRFDLVEFDLFDR